MQTFRPFVLRPVATALTVGDSLTITTITTKMKTPFFLILALMTLCTSATQASQERLAASIKEARAEAASTADQLKTTLDVLTALTRQTKGDLRPAFNAFTAEIPKTEQAARSTRARVQWMEGDGLNYFKEWQKTTEGITNESLQKKAQKRLNAVRKSYDKVIVSMKSASEKFQPFLSDLTDIQKALSQDVTADGVKAMRSTVSDANWRYKTVNGAVKDALKEMDKMAQSLSTESK